MADRLRGFNITDDLLTKHARLVFPPGAREKEQMSGPDVEKTKVIANLIIHVHESNSTNNIYNKVL